jgi:hypothetical protein
MDGASNRDAPGTTLGFGQAVTHVGNESMVRVWGGCDSERAGVLRDRLDDLAASGQRSAARW